MRDLIDAESPGAEFSGRSDIHCYFFPHALSFLREGGYIGLLTSSTWLDTTYGFRLQEFLLKNFEIVAVFESNCEPWFTGARVTTAATILRHQPDADKRAANYVKFVHLTRPLSELVKTLEGEGDESPFEALRDLVEGTGGEEEFTICPADGEVVRVRQSLREGMRVRTIQQADLFQLGRQAFTVGAEDEDVDDNGTNGNGQMEVVAETGAHYNARSYVGYKWGIFLRAPDVFFKLLRRGGPAFVPVGTIADVKFGIKTGCDSFFFPKDITDNALSTLSESELRERYGVSICQTNKMRIIQSGDGSAHLIEQRFVVPVVFNPMELHSGEVVGANLSRMAVMITNPLDELRGTQAAKYIRWGQKEGFSDRPTCASRNRWYQLPDIRPGYCLWTMTQRYRHVVPCNPSSLISNKRLFNINGMPGVNDDVLTALLNSTVVALMRYCFGRIQGGDPVIETEVVDVKMMLVPDPRRATPEVKGRLENAFGSMRRREIGHLVAVDSEDPGPTGDLAMEDRQALDDAVLELIGITDAKERIALRTELYEEITAMYRAIRQAEKRMQKFRSTTARRGKATPKSIAEEIWSGLDPKPVLVGLSRLAHSGLGEEVVLPHGKAQIVDTLFNEKSLLVGGRHIPLGHLDRVRFAKELVEEGVSGQVWIPNNPEECADALQVHEEAKEILEQEFSELASAYTADEGMKARVLKELWRKIAAAG